MRYPDYLADELLDLALNSRDESLLIEAEQLLTDPSIDFDWLPMVRWRNGAYWWMTDAISILVSNELLEYKPKTSTVGISEHVYYLTEAGEEFAKTELSGVQEFDSIRRRAKLAATIDPGAPGTALKFRQYQVEEYAHTAMGSTIPSRLEDVKTRALEVRRSW